MTAWICGQNLTRKVFSFLIIPARNMETRHTELNNIQSWSTENNLQLNCKKSQKMIISRPRGRQIQDIPELPDIRRVSSVKLLGVTLTEQFSMEQHIKEVISSSARALYALRILRTHGMKDEDLQTVFQAMALAKLLYTCFSLLVVIHQCRSKELPSRFPLESYQSTLPPWKFTHFL